MCVDETMKTSGSLSQGDLETFASGLPDIYDDHLLHTDMLLTLIADREGKSRDSVMTARLLLDNPEMSRDVVMCCIECGSPSLCKLARCRECCCSPTLATGESLEEIMTFGVEPLTLIDKRICAAVHNRDYCLGCHRGRLTTPSLLCQACIDVGRKVLTTGTNAGSTYREIAGCVRYIDYCSIHERNRELTGLVAYARSPAYGLYLLHLEDLVRCQVTHESPSVDYECPREDRGVTLVSNNGETPDELGTTSLLYWSFFNNLLTNKHLWSHDSDKVIELQLPETSYRAWFELVKAMRGQRSKLVGYTVVSVAVDFFGPADDNWLLYVHVDHEELVDRTTHYRRVGDIVRRGRRHVYATRRLRDRRQHDSLDTHQSTFPMLHGNFALSDDKTYDVHRQHRTSYIEETAPQSILTGILHSAYVVTQSLEWTGSRAVRVEVPLSAINWSDFVRLGHYHVLMESNVGALQAKTKQGYKWTALKRVQEAYLPLLEIECEHMLRLDKYQDALGLLRRLGFSHMMGCSELNYPQFPRRCSLVGSNTLVDRLTHNRHSCDESEVVLVSVDMILSQVHKQVLDHYTTLDAWAETLGLDSLYYCGMMLAHYAWLMRLAKKRVAARVYVIRLSDDLAIKQAEAIHEFLVARDYDSLPEEQRRVMRLR